MGKRNWGLGTKKGKAGNGNYGGEGQKGYPEGVSDMALYEKHQKLKKDLDQTVEEWEAVSMELEEMQGS